MKPGKQMMKAIVALCGLAIFFLVSCTSPGDDFIQGKWARGNVHFWDEWYFNQGTYWHIYDDTHDHIEEVGSYAVEEYGDDYVILELFDQRGGTTSIEDRVELKITFDLETETVHIRRSDYTRVESSTLGELATKQAP